MAQKSLTVSTTARQTVIARFQTEVDSLESADKEVENRLDTLKADRDEKEKAVIGEIEGISGSGKRGKGIAADRKDTAFQEADAKYKEFKGESMETLTQNKTRLAEIRTEIENETKKVSSANADADGVLARHEALFNIIKTQPGAALIYIPLFLGLLFLETMPLSIKVFGKKSVYDTALESEEALQTVEFEAEKDLVLAENKRLRDLQAALSEKYSFLILNDEIDTLHDENERKVVQKRKAEVLRKIDNMGASHQVSKNSDIKFGHEIAVEVVGHNDLQVKLQLPENVHRKISLKELESDIQSIADEIDDKQNLKLAKAFTSKGHEIWEDLPLLSQLEIDQKLILEFKPLQTI